MAATPPNPNDALSAQITEIEGVTTDHETRLSALETDFNTELPKHLQTVEDRLTTLENKGDVLAPTPASDTSKEVNWKQHVWDMSARIFGTDGAASMLGDRPADLNAPAPETEVKTGA